MVTNNSNFFHQSVKKNYCRNVRIDVQGKYRLNWNLIGWKHTIYILLRRTIYSIDSTYYIRFHAYAVSSFSFKYFFMLKTIPISRGGEFHLVIKSSDLENKGGGILSRRLESNNKKNLGGQMSDTVFFYYPNAKLKKKHECNQIITYK